MSERSPARTAGVWLLRLGGVLLVLEFLFSLLLTEHVSAVPVVLGVLAVALVTPPTRTPLSRLPIVGHGAVRGGAFLVGMLVAGSLLSALDRPAIVRADYAFVGATILTGHLDAEPISDGVVLVNADGTIVDVGTTETLPVPDGHQVVDLQGRYLLPGLINAHGHLMLPGRMPGEPIDFEFLAPPSWVVPVIAALMETYPGKRVLLWLMEENVRSALRAGVTTLRGLGDPHFVDVELRKRIESGRVLGPRLLVAGPILSVTGGHAHQIGQVFDGPDEARRAVRNSLHHQVDLIKIASTGGVADARRIGEAGELQMTPEEIAAITDEAHRKNVLVAAHAESAAGVLEALRAGVDSIEHGAELDEEAIRLFKNNPKALRGYTTLHPTLSVIAGSLTLTEAVESDPVLFVMHSNGKRIKKSILTGFGQAVASGVKIGVGTDAGIVRHDSVWKELTYFVEFGGVSNAQALYWGTLGTAESIGVEASTGSIDRGKSADLLIVGGNPLQDLSTLAEPAMVVASGVIVPLD